MSKTALLIFPGSETLEGIKDFCVATKDFFVSAGKILWYLTHPKTLGMLIWSGCVKYSLPICLTICLLALLLYVCGCKKFKFLISGSFLGYVVIQMINSAL